MFTKKQKKEYIKNFGHGCPYCKTRNTDIMGVIYEDDDGATKQDLECYECDKKWQNIYELSDIIHEDERAFTGGE